MLRGDKDETINHIISKCNKLVQKESKTKHDWVRKISNRNCGRSLHLNIRSRGIFTNQYPSGKIKRKNFPGIVRYKHITKYRPDPVIANKKREPSELLT